MTAPSHRPTKVVRIIARLNIGGPARHVLLLNSALTRSGYDTLLVHGSIGPGEASFEHLTAELGLPTRKIATLGRAVRLAGDLASFGQLVRVIFDERPDIVHTHTAKAGTLGRLAAALYNLTRPPERRCLIVHTFHGHVLEGYFSNAVSHIVRVTEQLLARLTDCIVAISESQRHDLVTRFKVASLAQTVVVPLGLDLGPLLVQRPKNLARRSFGLQDEQFVVGYAGRFVAIKDLQTLVRAFAVVAQQLPNAALLLAGDGPTRPQLEDLVVRLNIADHVKFAGWTEDLPSLYAAIDVCCLSSLNEGTPVALIEAMAAKKPIVATSVGGVVDLIEDGHTGILVPPRNVDALAGALLGLAADRVLCQRLGEAARPAVLEKFPVARLSRDIRELYEVQLRRKRRRP